MVLNFNRLAKFASAILFIALCNQSQLAGVLKFIFWYFWHFGEFMKYTYFILTFVISYLLSKSKPYQVYFNNRENKFERVIFNAINARNTTIITINFVTSPWTGNKVDSYHCSIVGIDGVEYYSLQFIVSIVKINLGIPYFLIRDLIITSPPLGHIVLEISWGSAYSAIFTFICLTIWF